MASPDELSSFVASSFRSVWALELLLLLKREGRACSTDELVTLMRASPAVVETALESLIAAGLAGSDGAIIKKRERIKRQTIEHRRLQHRKLAA